MYERLDVSLDPAGPDSLFDLAGAYIEAGDVVVDLGCRDGTHLIEMVRRFKVVGAGVEPVKIQVEKARSAVRHAGLSDRITLHEGAMHDVPYPDAYFDFVWCRDVVEQVDDLEGALREMVRIMKPRSHVLINTTVTTDRLTAQDAALLGHHLGNVDGNLDRSRLEDAFTRSGLTIEKQTTVGTEWAEHAEERSQPTSRALLRLARLRRQREVMIADHGLDIYKHIEANLHWEVFLFLGKLEPIVYELASP